MAEIITAVYEEGVLRPTRPLRLKEHQTVRLQLLPVDATEAENVFALLAAAGFIQRGVRRVPLPPDPVSAEERQKLAKVLGQAPGRPLSDIMLDERGPR